MTFSLGSVFKPHLFFTYYIFKIDKIYYRKEGNKNAVKKIGKTPERNQG